MRLLVVTQVFWPENFRINDLVAELVLRGHQVTVLTGLPNYPEGRIFPQFRENPGRFNVYQGAEIVRVPVLPRGSGSLRLILNYLNFVVSASLLGVWRLRGLKFDAILVYEPSPVMVGLPAALLRAVKRAPIAFWVLDLWPETLEAVGVVRSPRVLRLVGRLVTFIYARCDLILAQSRSFIPQIRKYAGETKRVEYFANWSEQIINASGQAAPAEEVPPLPGAFNVMFAGNIGDAQDFPAILDAAEILKPNASIRWLVVGDGRKGRWVSEEIARRGLQDRVLMLGRHPVERMPSFFKCADALLVSLKDEPIFAMTVPGKLQSYLAAGIPIVAMLNGEGAEVVELSGAGLTCSAGDAAGLAAAVLRLSQASREERLAMGEKGLEISAREFDRGKQMDKIERWLLELAGGRLAADALRSHRP
jgi:colanic acid biosynthesis glycosyl transferase WcaI